MAQSRESQSQSPYDSYMAARRRSRIREGVIVIVVLAAVIGYSIERRSHDAAQSRPIPGVVFAR